MEELNIPKHSDWDTISRNWLKDSLKLWRLMSKGKKADENLINFDHFL